MTPEETAAYDLAKYGWTPLDVGIKPTKPKIVPAEMKPISAKDRVTIRRPVRVLRKPDGPTTRAAGHDTTPGHDELHHYWTKGPGLAKWADHPHAWTALYHHLVKYMTPERAKRAASEWFHEVKGYWPGDQKGKNPVGPG